MPKKRASKARGKADRPRRQEGGPPYSVVYSFRGENKETTYSWSNDKMSAIQMAENAQINEPSFWFRVRDRNGKCVWE